MLLGWSGVAHGNVVEYMLILQGLNQRELECLAGICIPVLLAASLVDPSPLVCGTFPAWGGCCVTAGTCSLVCRTVVHAVMGGV